jgi:hypothetical protein
MGIVETLDERVADIAAAAAGCAAESERRHHLDAPVVEALIRSGLAGLVAPSALGGSAAHPGRLVEVVQEISRADGSAGWCVAIGIGSNYLAGILPEPTAKEVFRDVTRPGAGTFTPGGRAQVSGDGYLISGRWTYANGCRHAAIAASGVMIFDGGKPAELNPDGSPVVRLAVLTEDQFTVEETWDTVGREGPAATTSPPPTSCSPANGSARSGIRCGRRRHLPAESLRHAGPLSRGGPARHRPRRPRRRHRHHPSPIEASAPARPSPRPGRRSPRPSRVRTGRNPAPRRPVLPPPDAGDGVLVGVVDVV